MAGLVAVLSVPDAEAAVGAGVDEPWFDPGNALDVTGTRVSPIGVTGIVEQSTGDSNLVLDCLDVPVGSLNGPTVAEFALKRFGYSI